MSDELRPKFGVWKNCVITQATDDQLSAEVDLGYDFTHINVLVPTITSAGISARISNKKGGTFYPVYDWIDSDADTDILQLTLAETTSKAITLKIGGARHIKIHSSNAQSGNVTFLVRGSNL